MLRYPSAVLAVSLCAAVPGAADATPYEVEGVKLDVTAAADAPEYMVGEPGEVLLTVANRSDRGLRLLVGGDYRNRLGRPDSFKVETVARDGRKVPQPDPGIGLGGIVHAAKLPAKGEYVYRLFLLDWATFKEPGTYRMTIRRRLELVPDDGGDAFSRKTTEIDVSATATITIVPADADKFGRLIARLGAKVVARDTEDYERAEKMLGSIHDERVIPYYVALAEKPRSWLRGEACRVLGRYNNDLAFETLEKLLLTTADDVREGVTTDELAVRAAEGVRGSAVHGISTSPHPKALPRLWSFAGDPEYGVRLTVLHKAAEVKTREAVAVINRLTADENETVRNEARRYQRELANGRDRPDP
jgi:hypothetical protein